MPKAKTANAITWLQGQVLV